MNKVKFGLSEVHIAPITAESASGYTYGDIFAIPGAVSLSLDRAGDETDFYADNIKYFNESANQGYTGSLEMAIFTDEFRKKILGELQDTNGALIEDATKGTTGFALGFQIDGDRANRRFWYYNCMANRPSNSSSTIESTKEPQTETVDITAAPRASDKLVRAVLEKTDENANVYNTFFSTVYETQ
ncbi:MAG: phage tail protein [Bacilli bacterium]|nr:phage tail protein [Bacilli bacterium]